MALLLKKGFALYRHVFDDLSDPRTSGWFMCGGLGSVLLLLGAYLYFVLNLGPRLMERRKPFNLNKVMIVYNALQVMACLHVVKEAFHMYYYDGFSLTCEPVDYGTSEKGMRIASAFWFYYMMKIVDLMDTVFFVLRKKQRQISFLHVYHHTGMILIGYVSTKFLAGGHGAFVGLANSLVHVILYSHYLLSIINPEYGRNGWYKKYITQLQIVQFAMMVFHFGILIFQPECTYPKFTVGVVVPQNIFMALLFYDFYRRTYNKGSAKRAESASVAAKTDSKTCSAEVGPAAAPGRASSAKSATMTVSPDSGKGSRRAG